MIDVTQPSSAQDTLTPHTPSNFKIGLTGGIASGKSTLADYFSDYGIEVISADRIARDILLKDSPTLALVVKAFGPDILTAEQTLDRVKLRHLIFKNDKARQQLDAITHPAIARALMLASGQARSAYVILEIPLLIEANMSASVDRVLVVNIALEEQIERIMQRDQGTRHEAELAITSQVSAQTRLKYADDIVHNNASLHKLKQQVALLHTLYTKLARNNTRQAITQDISAYRGLDLH